MRTKLNGQKVVTTSKVIVPAGITTCTTRSKLREAASRYQTPLSQDIEGMDPPKILILPRFMLYNGKSDPRSHVSHVR